MNAPQTLQKKPGRLLKTFSNRYNLLAELIPDYNSIPLTFVKFSGLDKTLINIFQKV